MHPQVMGCAFHQLMLMLEVEFMAGDGLDNLEPLAVLPGPHYKSSQPWPKIVTTIISSIAMVVKF